MLNGYSADGVCQKLRETFDKCGDFNLRPILCAGKNVYLANIGNFSGRTYITESVVKPLVAQSTPPENEDAFAGILCSSEAEKLTSFDSLVEKVLAGSAVVFTDIPDGVSAYAASARNDPSRGVGEPQNEVVVRGPREGFIEKAEDNVALLRKRLRTPNMKVLNTKVGKCSETTVKVVYLENVADAALVDDILRRIAAIKLDSVMDSGYIEQFLTDGHTASVHRGRQQRKARQGRCQACRRTRRHYLRRKPGGVNRAVPVYRKPAIGRGLSQNAVLRDLCAHHPLCRHAAFAVSAGVLYRRDGTPQKCRAAGSVCRHDGRKARYPVQPVRRACGHSHHFRIYPRGGRAYAGCGGRRGQYCWRPYFGRCRHQRRAFRAHRSSWWQP